jgi:hypothetical protein
MDCLADDGREAARDGWCHAHHARIRKHGDPLLHIPLKAPRSDLGRSRGPHDRRLLDPQNRPCRSCKQAKPLTDFGPDKNGPLGRKRECRACQAARAARDRQQNDSDPERRSRRLDGQRRSYVKQAYGAAGLAAYARIRAGEPCDVCGNRPAGQRGMAIDHCHRSARVRGILCKDCNLVLGWMNDDPARLRALAAYLEHASVPAPQA